MSEPSGRLRLCATRDVEPGGMHSVDIDGLPRLVVYRIGDQYYCSQDTCTHGGASLHDDGKLRGYIVECSWHDGQFDIRTGEACALPCTEPLRTFAVSRVGDDLFIDLP